MLKVGVRVVRGPNWSWGNEDGGEGFVGVLREVNATNKIAIVQWDNGNQMQCRIGYLDKYDLRVLDNAQIGIKHKRIVCDVCENGVIHGMRYKCINCDNFDLCYSCYHSDKHDLNHSFVRIEKPNSAGTNLPPRISFRKCELKGVFKGAEVIRGVDWEWGNQDGGRGKLGIVLDVRGWSDKSSRSTVYVQWLHGNTELYRLGHKGNCDVQFVESTSGGYYYPDHLPILGQNEQQMEWNLILDTIEIQQVMQLENESMETTSKVDDDIKKMEKYEEGTHSNLIQLGSVESMYAAKVIKYNEAINRDLAKLDLVKEFSDMIGELRNEESKEIWEMIKYMTQLPEISRTKDVIKNRYRERFIEVMVQNAKKYLEKSFKTYMLGVVNKNFPEMSQSDTYLLVHSFVGLRFEKEYIGLQDGVIDNRPLWPMVYYSLRLGDLTTAVRCLESSPLVFPEIVLVLKAMLNPSSDPSIEIFEENIRFYYRTVIRNETDPFKRAVWAILGACDELSEVVRTADDFLWFNLNVGRNDVYSQYVHLQYKILEEQGETHYNAFDKPLLYFKLLLLTGQFEPAVDFLFRTDRFKADAVHMAIALNEMNLLALSQDANAPLLSVDQVESKSARRLNLTLLIKSYVGKLESLNEKLHYYFLLRNCSDAEGKSIFEVLVTDLAITTKQYDAIFGSREKSGTKRVGLIDQFKNVNVKIETVVQVLFEREQYNEIMQLANSQEEALKLMCLMLSKVAHLENQPGSLRNKLQEKAILLESKLSQTVENITSPDRNSFIKLKGLLAFFDFYRAKEYPDALKVLLNLEILPFRFTELNVRVRNMKNFNEDFHRVVPDVLLATMTILLDQNNKIINVLNDPLYLNPQLRCIWEQANCIINFAEKLPHIVNQDITERLIRIEILMHA